MLFLLWSSHAWEGGVHDPSWKLGQGPSSPRPQPPAMWTREGLRQELKDQVHTGCYSGGREPKNQVLVHMGGGEDPLGISESGLPFLGVPTCPTLSGLDKDTKGRVGVGPGVPKNISVLSFSGKCTWEHLPSTSPEGPSWPSHCSSGEGWRAGRKPGQGMRPSYAED